MTSKDKNINNTQGATEKLPPIGEFDIKNLDLLVTNLINEELGDSSLAREVFSMNEVISLLLKDLEGFLNVFSCDFTFSFEEKSKWEEMEQLLHNIYNPEDGTLKSLKDHFFLALYFRATGTELSTLAGRRISSQEEFFLRSIFVKIYLINLKQLIIPFRDVNDEFLADFKKQRVAQLEGRRLEEDDDLEEINNELDFLDSITENLELKKQAVKQQENDLDKKLNFWKTNTGANFLGSVETAHYIASFINHKTDKATLQITSGSNELPLFTYCSRIISTIVKLERQIVNSKNSFHSNNDKQLIVAMFVNDLKLNLITIQQQFIEQYLTDFPGYLLRKKLPAGKLLTIRPIEKKGQGSPAVEQKFFAKSPEVKKKSPSHQPLVSARAFPAVKNLALASSKSINIPQSATITPRRLLADFDRIGIHQLMNTNDTPLLNSISPSNSLFLEVVADYKMKINKYRKDYSSYQQIIRKQRRKIIYMKSLQAFHKVVIKIVVNEKASPELLQGKLVATEERDHYLQKKPEESYSPKIITKNHSIMQILIIVIITIFTWILLVKVASLLFKSRKSKKNTQNNS